MSTWNIIFSVVLILLFIFIGVIFIKLKQTTNMYKELLSGVHKGNLEDILKSHLDNVKKLESNIKNVDKAFSHFKIASRNHIQKIGFNRFNPFHETGGDQSFAFVILDAHNNGVIISSFHQRDVTRVYAKEVLEGKSKQKLSKEEEETLQQAINS